jgi:hypothetical protein
MEISKEMFHLDICFLFPKSVTHSRDISPITGREVPTEICNYCGTILYSPNGYNGYQYVDKIGNGKILDRVKYRVEQKAKDVGN